jgi:hypothetical protein
VVDRCSTEARAVLFGSLDNGDLSSVVVFHPPVTRVLAAAGYAGNCLIVSLRGRTAVCDRARPSTRALGGCGWFIRGCRAGTRPLCRHRKRRQKDTCER